MTEAEWLKRDWPSNMLELMIERSAAIHGRSGVEAADTKFRLFGCGACRRVWGLLANPASRTLVEAAERFALQQAAFDEVQAASQFIERPVLRRNDPRTGAQLHATDAVLCLGHRTARTGALELLNKVIAAALCDPDQPEVLDRHCSALLRCIFGNPFRPVSFDVSWRTTTAAAIAKQMYDSRDFSAMPILADALQDAGCDNDDVLNHCRAADGVHVRGCWVVDLVLDKK
jgi:hypothetical protein